MKLPNNVCTYLALREYALKGINEKKYIIINIKITESIYNFSLMCNVTYVICDVSTFEITSQNAFKELSAVMSIADIHLQYQHILPFTKHDICNDTYNLLLF